MILTCDPGTKVMGLSLWEDGELACAWLARGDFWLATAIAAHATIAERIALPFSLITDVVIERPQVYVQRRLKGDPNDLITVAMAAGAFVQPFYGHARVVELRPHQWKGNVPKNVAIKRYQARLSSEERGRVDATPRSLAHNVWDAVGLGQYYHARRDAPLEDDHGF